MPRPWRKHHPGAIWKEELIKENNTHRTDCILVATDFSEPSYAALRYAIDLATEFGAKLDVIHVIREMVFYSPAFGGFMPSREQYAAAATAMLEGAVESEGTQNLQVATGYRFGVPHVEILKHAESLGNPIIVVGTHGRGPVTHAVLGSVAENIVRYSSCPVLTIRGNQTVSGTQLEAASG